MKKLLCALATGIALSLCAVTAFLAKPTDESVSAASDGSYNVSDVTCVSADADCDCEEYGKNFVDEDGDGVCDNKGSCQGNGQGKGSCQGNGQGKGNAQGNGKGKGSCQGNGQGKGKGSRGGCGR